jgi:hypothetical protein
MEQCFCRNVSHTEPLGQSFQLVMLSSLICAHLAHETKRAYVFQDYYWAPEHYPFKIMPDSPFPSTPLTALVGGPLVGGPWEEGDTTPRSVSQEYWERICPVGERDIIHTGDIKPSLEEADGLTVFWRWAEVIRNISGRCVEVWPDKEHDTYPQTFDLYLLGDHRIDTLWHTFKNSATSRLLDASGLVKSAIANNMHLFPRFRNRFFASTDPSRRMMALHIRRKDYERHCDSLTFYSSLYFHWNHLPELLDQFPSNLTAKERYENHCYPDIDKMKQRIRETRNAYVANGAGRVLNILYVATNADSGWIKSFKAAMTKDGWPTVVTIRDFTLNDEQIGVGMSVDTEICRKAAVFVGNGVSPFRVTTIDLTSHGPFAVLFYDS